ncbi:hypothetical protein AB0E27_34460 [Streptomyces sparsogenes]|uniref:hypothetical protein n=1 Tax=Streptomyces sparsogenes TaxID=67365 RepID=UPI0033DEADA8
MAETARGRLSVGLLDLGEADPGEVGFARCADIAETAGDDPHLTTHTITPPPTDAYR